MSTVILLEDSPRNPAMRTTLDKSGYQVLAELSDASELQKEVSRLSPDVIIVITETPNADTLERVSSITSSHPRPVVMFARDESRDVIRKAVQSGVSAYVVDGWAPERLAAIIEAASARFDAYQAVKDELATTRRKLSERKVIEKAKGIVMHERGMSEDAAYSALRSMAMNQSLPLVEVARRVISIAGLLT